MFPRKNRLPITTFPKKGPKISSASFFLRWEKNNLGTNRFGIIIGIVVDKRSSHRHKLRRSIEERLRRTPDMGMDVLCIVLPAAAKMSQKDISIEIDSALNKLSPHI